MAAMESENESNNKGTANVRELQATLFPPTPRITNFFTSFYIKSGLPDEDDEDQIKETVSALYNFTKDTTFTPQPPRWPTECQVIEEKIQHINYNPAQPEPYYAVTGKEVEPKPTGDDVGMIVYQYSPISAVNYFTRSSVGGSKYLFTSTLCPEENSLEFESRFECGNLERAIRITPNYYELHLRADLYTNKHQQWFYFRIRNVQSRFLYRFSIVNFSKGDSLYNEGMRPLMYSVKEAEIHGIGWRRCGENITYYSNDNVTADDTDQQMTYTLTFTTEFPYDDDEVYLAHSYPYTYTDLEEYLSNLTNDPVKSAFTTVRILCKSLAGNNVHYVTVTSPRTSGYPDKIKKKAVVVTARVHPGETPSSWIMKGILDFLTSDSSPAKELREKFIFKLVPMLNPDGVIVGNNRCSLGGKDLNRQYRTVIREAYPSIWYTKLMVRRLLEECGVAMYCDLHAHSRKHNIFVYGCENRRNSERKLQEQVFPLMLRKNAAEKFCFESCKFRIQKTKEGTGRVVMWMMGIANSYTMEASFAGSTLGNRNETHFSVQDYEQMGRAFCQTLLDFYDEDPRKEKLRLKIVERLSKEGSNADEPTNIQLSDYSSDDGDTSSSSSNEVGRDEEEIFCPSVPPPSPNQLKKPKAKMHHIKNKLTKNTNVSRKLLPIYRTTLGLTVSEKEYESSDSEYESHKERVKIKRTRKKKFIKKKSMERTECETKLRSVSVLELVPGNQMQASITSIKEPKSILEKRNVITRRLSQVQAKLMALQTKVWCDLEEAEAFRGILPECNDAFGFPEVTLLAKTKSKKKSKKHLNKENRASANEEKKKLETTELKTAIAYKIDKTKIKKSFSLSETIEKSDQSEKRHKKRLTKYTKKV